MKSNYYQWRLNYVINKHGEFKEWLLYKGADIFVGSAFDKGEVFKFKMSGGVGILYKTGRCNPFFNKMAKAFKNECKESKKCVA